MSFRAWCLAVALGLTCTSLQAQEQAGSSNDRAGDQQGYSEPAGIPVRIIEDKRAAETAERREEEAHKWQYDDLITQKSMDAAAHSSKRAAWISTGLVFLGTALLFWTLDLTRKANAAAQEAVNVTKDIGQKQVRAYLSIAEAKMNIIPYKGGVYWEFFPTVKNTGQSPAANVTVRVAVNRTMSPEVTPHIWPNIGAGEVHSGKISVFQADHEINRPPGAYPVIAPITAYINVSATDVFGINIGDQAQFYGEFNVVEARDIPLERTRWVAMG